MREDVEATVSSTGADDAPAIAIASPLLRGSTVGRFLILGERGEGGMGRIYEAYDPELDRKVAIKLVRAERISARGAALEGERLLREAQAMAKVAHASVVSVFEVGTLDDQIFVAMELVDGPDLAAWLAQRRRGWREVIDVFVAAGRGLAATHAAGLVHRDFKPSNVVVSAGGAKVLDFGLAIAGDAAATGEIAGTPRYMAPEQRDGRRADARADQYSFCSALGDALTRADGAPPRAVRRVLTRGLRDEPSDRFASMTELLDALVRARRRRAWIAGLALAAIGAGALALIVTGGGAPACHDGRAQLAGVWDAAAIARAQRSFASVPGGAAAFAHLRAPLDRYADAWVDMRDDACRATEVRHEQSAELLDLRMACLDERKAELGAFAGQLGAIDAASLDAIVEAVAKLRSLRPCADVASLRAPEAPPTPFTGAGVATIRGELARARVLGLVGKVGEGYPLVVAQVEKARTLGWRPLVAETLLVRGKFEVDFDKHGDAERSLFDALWNAEASRDDRVAAEAWLMLLRLAIKDGDVRARSDGWPPRAGAAIARIGGDPDLEAQLVGSTASIAFQRGRYAEAKTQWDLALATAERAFPPDSPKLAGYEQGVAITENSLGHGVEAERHYRRAIALGEAGYGSHSPWLVPVYANLGDLLVARGDLDGGISSFRRAIALHEENPGSSALDVASAEMGLGNALGDEDRYDDALAAYERARADYASATGDETIEVATVHANIAATLLVAGHADRALVEARAALAIDERRAGPEHPATAAALIQIGDASARLGDRDGARTSLERAIAILDRGTYDQRLVGNATMSLGALWLAKPDLARARPLLERAVAVREHWGLPSELAESRAALAFALWDVDRSRARALIDLARPALVPGSGYAVALATWDRAHARDR